MADTTPWRLVRRWPAQGLQGWVRSVEPSTRAQCVLLAACVGRRAGWSAHLAALSCSRADRTSRGPAQRTKARGPVCRDGHRSRTRSALPPDPRTTTQQVDRVEAEGTNEGGRQSHRRPGGEIVQRGAYHQIPTHKMKASEFEDGLAHPDSAHLTSWQVLDGMGWLDDLLVPPQKRQVPMLRAPGDTRTPADLVALGLEALSERWPRPTRGVIGTGTAV